LKKGLPDMSRLCQKKISGNCLDIAEIVCCYPSAPIAESKKSSQKDCGNNITTSQPQITYQSTLMELKTFKEKNNSVE
jgi:hypothetical protein